MAAKDFPTDLDMSVDEVIGFRKFLADLPLDRCTNADSHRGWWIAHRRVYGQGVKASQRALRDDINNPYVQFSPAWEAWATGFEEGDSL